ncbi:MAG: heparin lyase I family protein [Verrucomicrobiota bacterium]
MRTSMMAGVVSMILGVQGINGADGTAFWEANPDYRSMDSAFLSSEVQSPNRIQLVNDPAGQFNKAYSIKILDGDYVASGERSEVKELKINGEIINQAEGDDWYYGWRSYIDISPNNVPTLDNEFLIINQWRSGGFNTPPLKLKLDDGKIRLSRYSKHGFDAGDGSTNPWLTDGVPFQPATWYEFVVRINCSNNPNVGFVEFWINGEQQTFLNGTTRHYYMTMDVPGNTLKFKTGIYRHPNLTGTVTHYNHTMRVGTTYDSVAPDTSLSIVKQEAESATISTIGAGYTNYSNTTLSEDEGIRFNGNSIGDSIEFTIPNVAAGVYRPMFTLVPHAFGGIYDIYLDTTKVMEGFDLNGNPGDLIDTDLTAYSIPAGDLKVRFVAVGTSGGGNRYRAYVDRFILDIVGGASASATVEAEATPFVASGASAAVEPSTQSSGGHWVRFNGNNNGDYIEFDSPNLSSGNHPVKIDLRKSKFSGKYRLKINGMNVGASFDLYRPSGSQIVEYDFGSVNFPQGVSKIRFTRVGQHPDAPKSRIYVDRLKLE